MRHSINPAKQGGNNKPTNEMKRKDKIALLNKWGISTSKNATDEFINTTFDAISKLHNVKFKNGKDGDHDDSCDCADCMGGKNAPEPDAEKPDADGEGTPEQEGPLWKAATENAAKLANKANKAVESFLNRERTRLVKDRIANFITEGRITPTTAKDWTKMALDATEAEDGTNPVLENLAQLPVALPGQAPLNIEMGESDSIADLDKNVQHLMKAQNYHSRNGTKAENLRDRMIIGDNMKRVSQLVNRIEKVFRQGTRFVQFVRSAPAAYRPLARGLGFLGRR